MKTAPKRTSKNLRPKHKQTKDYLKHYYPFIPLFASIGFLLMVIFSPLHNNQNVLAVVTNINHDGLLESTNVERQKAGAQTLQVNQSLTLAAQNKANDMVARNYWSHKTPTGQEPWIFINRTGYTYQKAGENLAYGFDSSDKVVTGWMNSKTHRDNLLDNSFTDVGFGIAKSNDFNNSGAETIVVAYYAQPVILATNTTESNSNIHILGTDKTISTAGVFTGVSWAVYLIGAIVGASTMYLASSHGNRIRKAVKKGERYFVKRPLLDSAVITLIAFGIILLRSAGYIL